MLRFFGPACATRYILIRHNSCLRHFLIGAVDTSASRCVRLVRHVIELFVRCN